MIYSTRREQVQRVLYQERVDAILVTNPINVTYLTGFSGESSYLVVSRERTILVSDGRFTAQIAEECPDVETFIRPPAQTVLQAAAAVVAKLAPRSIGFESGHVTVSEMERLRELTTLEWKGAGDRIERLRAIKDESEIEQIREAIRIAQRAFAMFRSMLRPEDSEKELFDAMENYVRRAGAFGTSFPSIIAVGDRSALPHAPPGKRRVGDADLLLVDWGAGGRFYKSDLTRVLLTHNNSGFPGPPRARNIDPKLKEIYKVVLQAQQQAIRFLRPGVKAQEVDAQARGVISQAGYGEYFAHGLGHGIGLQIHEAPYFKPGNQYEIQAGMVVTIEPGIYIPGWGGVRIEDDLLVTPEGCEVLTSLPRDLESNILEW
jgi:Xaa-Pro aminopeptidase